MSNLLNILNPVGGRKKSVKLILNSHEHASPSDIQPSPSPSIMSGISEQAEPHLAAPHVYKASHEPHPDCPDTLGCLPDTNGRPQHTLPVILRCAILGSPKQRLTIREIYATMEAKYSYYRTAGPSWKQSVRHHLSLNRLFERQPRPVTEPGFGSYWTVNLAAPPGTKRPRKRGRPNNEDPNGVKIPRKRGRPRKNPIISSPTENQLQAPPLLLPLLSRNEIKMDEDEKDPLNIDGGDETSHNSEDELESEEEMEIIHPLDRRASLTGLTAYADRQPMMFTMPPPPPPPQKLPVPPSLPRVPSVYPTSYPLPALSSMGKNTDNIIDKLQSEIASLRKQAAEAVSVSLRLSDQASAAQAEAARARVSLKTAEAMLEEESRRRKDAETMLEEECQRRQDAETILEEECQQRQDAETILEGECLRRKDAERIAEDEVRRRRLMEEAINNLLREHTSFGNS